MRKLVKANSIIAFSLTLIALLLVLGLIGWLLFEKIQDLRKGTKYCDQFLVELRPEVYSIEADIGRGRLVKVEILNQGFEDEFKISVDGPSWVIARPTKVRLDQGEKSEIFIYISPGVGARGEYTVSIYAKSYCGVGETKLKISV
ncbi:MAG: hypothetical protein QXY45_02785 [Candidatus Aenigmatarchaeota archaeon]